MPYFSFIQLFWGIHKLRFHENFVKWDQMEKSSLEIILHSYVTHRGKVTAEHGWAVASVWGSVCLCMCENPGTCALCRMRNLGLESFCCNWVFLLSACPCVLRYTCGFSMGTQVPSVYGVFCTCGIARGRANFEIAFPDFPPGLKPKWKWCREPKWN